MHMGYHKTYCNFKEYFMGGLGWGESTRKFLRGSGGRSPPGNFLKIQEIFARINIVALLIKANIF